MCRAIGQVAFVNYTNIHNSLHVSAGDAAEGPVNPRPLLYRKRLQESFLKWRALEYARQLLGGNARAINLAWSAATICHVVSVRLSTDARTQRCVCQTATRSCCERRQCTSIYACG